MGRRVRDCTGLVDADRLYRWPGGVNRAVGIDDASCRELRRRTDLPVVVLFRKKFVHGADLIEAIREAGKLDDVEAGRE